MLNDYLYEVLFKLKLNFPNFLLHIGNLWIIIFLEYAFKFIAK